MAALGAVYEELLGKQLVKLDWLAWNAGFPCECSQWRTHSLLVCVGLCVVDNCGSSGFEILF
jgi:hypothetical protein